MNWPAVVPPGVTTMMLTVPALPGGLVTVICVAESAVTAPAAPPKLTPLTPARPVPVIVTDVPPPVGPLAGDIPVSAGAGGDEEAEAEGEALADGEDEALAEGEALAEAEDDDEPEDEDPDADPGADEPDDGEWIPAATDGDDEPGAGCGAEATSGWTNAASRCIAPSPANCARTRRRSKSRTTTWSAGPKPPAARSRIGMNGARFWRGLCPRFWICSKRRANE